MAKEREPKFNNPALLRNKAGLLVNKGWLLTNKDHFAQAIAPVLTCGVILTCFAHSTSFFISALSWLRKSRQMASTSGDNWPLLQPESATRWAIWYTFPSK